MGLGRIRVVVQNYAASAPAKLLDSEIQIQGVCGGIFNAKQQLIGIVVYVQDLNSLRVLEPGTLTAETPSVESIRDLARLNERTTSGHRVKVRGVVTLQRPFSALYIKDATESLEVETSQPTTVQPGDEVEVWGFPALGEGSRKLEDAEFRKLASGPPPCRSISPWRRLCKATSTVRWSGSKAGCSGRLRKVILSLAPAGVGPRGFSRSGFGRRG